MSSQEDNENLMPELKDIISRIKAYNRLHPEGCFIYNFLGFKKDTDNTCDDCGGHCDKPDENKSIGGAFGHIEDIRYLCNMIRDIAEDVKDEADWVDI
jgi:hypothetical protein